MNQESYFDGSVISYIVYHILATVMSLFTFGLATPWIIAMLYSWEARHTVVQGKRLYFDGNGGQLFGNWLIWLLLCFITFGLYAISIPVQLLKWKTKHTKFYEN